MKSGSDIVWIDWDRLKERNRIGLTDHVYYRLYSETGLQKVVLYDRLSFIRGKNIWKCSSMFMLKEVLYERCSLIAVVLKHRFHCI